MGEGTAVVSNYAFVCASDSMHPYECGGGCLHCKRQVTDTHDPATCALCDPAYDFLDNPYREADRDR